MIGLGIEEPSKGSYSCKNFVGGEWMWSWLRFIMCRGSVEVWLEEIGREVVELGMIDLSGGMSTNLGGRGFTTLKCLGGLCDSYP